MAIGLPAFLYDGSSAVRHEVSLFADATMLRIEQTGAEPEMIPYDHLVGLERRDGLPVFGHAYVEGWRLILQAPPEGSLADKLPITGTYGSFIDRLGLGKAIAVFGLFTFAVIYVLLAAPQWLAPLVPMKWEKGLGDTFAGSFEDDICSSKQGDAALAKLAAKLDDNPSDIKLSVINSPIVNAAAMPGGQVMLFNGLLTRAENPDEVAGVLAHELGHVRKRHVMASLLRQFGVGIFLGNMDPTGGYATSLLNLSYTRSAEEEADDYALTTIQKAKISPDATGDFFAFIQRLDPFTGEERKSDEAMPESDGASDWNNGLDRAFSYLQTHPVTKDREMKFRNAQDNTVAYRPALTASEWSALQHICD